MKKLDSIMLQQLDKRKVDGALRALVVTDPNLVDFTSNDYLGLARSTLLSDMIALKKQQLQITKNGSTGSRLLSGNTSIAVQTESLLAEIFWAESTLLFNSGYSANLAVLSSLPQRKDTIIYDEYAHACIKDGARLSMATRLSFKHNDLEDLESKLKKVTGHAFIAVESIYSMDGDECPLGDLIDLSEKYEATVILDEAHSTGTYAEHGAGFAASLNLEKRVPVRIHTFGKAMGVHGACVAGSDVLCQYLVNFARPFIYTTAPDPHSIIAIGESFNYLKDHHYLQQELREKIDRFTVRMEGCDSRIKSTSSIQAFIIPGNENCRAAAKRLQSIGMDVRPILSPTVRAGQERLRICLHSFNTDEQIRRLTDDLRLISNLQHTSKA
jgi:8-amino-7-oxononanoate synthase